MFSWGRVTGKDKRLKHSNQQASFLGRLGNYTIAFPYGLYADLPTDTLLKEIAPGVAIPVTVERPDDTEQGEPVFFHPATNTRIIARNNGDLDISTTDTGGNVNIETVSANITASTSVVVDSPNTTFTGDVQINGKLDVDGDITSLANVIATLLLQGATLTVTGAGSIDGQDYTTHAHTQANDSGGNTEANTGGVV